MSSYILTLIFAALILLIAAVVSTSIKYEGGANPKDPGKRKMWFWIFAILNPVLFGVLAYTVLEPHNRRDLQQWRDSLPLAIVVGFLIYILLGFVLSKVFKNGKLGNWF